jgi:hypothetical protein
MAATSQPILRPFYGSGRGYASLFSGRFWRLEALFTTEAFCHDVTKFLSAGAVGWPFKQQCLARLAPIWLIFAAGKGFQAIGTLTA